MKKSARFLGGLGGKQGLKPLATMSTQGGVGVTRFGLDWALIAWSFQGT